MAGDVPDASLRGLLSKASGVVHVGPPLDIYTVRQGLPTARLVQFHESLTDGEFKALGELMLGFPEVELRAYGTASTATLGFLRHFPHLRRLCLDQPCLADVSPLNELVPELESLALGETYKTLDLRPLRLRGLRRLRVEGHRRGLAELAGGNAGLRVLSLRGLAADRSGRFGRVEPGAEPDTGDSAPCAGRAPAPEAHQPRAGQCTTQP